MGRAFEFRKARKFKRWGNMAKLFTRYGREIVMAVKAGGPSPDTNPKLRTILKNAKGDNIPKDNIERAIKKATSKDQADYKEIVYEGYGPYGIAILVECASDNHMRTVGNIRSYFNKFGGTLGTTGSLDFLFERKCRFKVQNDNYNVEDLELELIDSGAEEVFIDEENFVWIYGQFPDFGNIQKALEERNMEIINAEFERIPNDLKELTPEQQAEVEKLIDKIDEDDDVTHVYHNMK